jgi:peptidyl-prolyl cis-trans isomerase B (cyclophilin B)
VTSTRERQRAAARARLEREMAERAARARKRRQMQAAIGAGVALLLVIAGTVWLVSSLGDDEDKTAAPTPSTSAGPQLCVWQEAPKQKTGVKNVGTPPSGKEPRSGKQVMTIKTNYGDVEVTMDLAKSPCTAASFSYLASKNFYDGTKCHRMFPGMLQCGDPFAKGNGYRKTDGQGGPSYTFADENLPIGQRPAYPKGVVAMANSGENTNGSQFFIIYEDQELNGPNYVVVGKVTKGMDVVEKATKPGHDGAFDPQPGGGHPKKDILLNDVTVGPVAS